MYLMTKGRGQKHCLVLVSVCFALSLAAGCARQQSDSNASGAEQTLPFHADSQAFEGDGRSPAIPPDTKVANAAPFHAELPPAVLPAGTLLTVELPNLLSANQVQPGKAFSASVAAPFTIDGKTLLERGTVVKGRIESVRLDDANRFESRGYIRLTLNSIKIGGKTVPIHTLSLYTRALVQPSNILSGPASARIQKGRRLTFRLTAPVALDNSSAAQLSVGGAPRPPRGAE
jgi:hypothetical protein